MENDAGDEFRTPEFFSQKEVEYIKSQRLARIGTASKDGVPDVAAVGFDFDGKDFYVGGMHLTKTHKYKNALQNPQVSLVIDDLKSVEPWHPRFVKIFGAADLVKRKGYTGQATYIRITPHRKTSWGLD
jgi:pyridoxamine 5'-phosphate oxidase family protein